MGEPLGNIFWKNMTFRLLGKASGENIQATTKTYISIYIHTRAPTFALHNTSIHNNKIHHSQIHYDQIHYNKIHYNKQSHKAKHVGGGRWPALQKGLAAACWPPPTLLALHVLQNDCGYYSILYYSVFYYSVMN